MKLSLIILLFPLLTGFSGGNIRARYEVCYSPKGGCTRMITNFIDSAKPKKSILMMAYVLTSDIISNSLIKAKQRGVNVTILVDKNAPLARGADAKRLSDVGIEVLVDKNHPISHSKSIIIGNAVQTGSFNYSSAAEYSNQENALILYSVPKISKNYRDFFDSHRLHSFKLE